MRKKKEEVKKPVAKKVVEKKEPEIRIFLATPMYGGQCTGQYVQSLLNFITLCNTLRIPVNCAFMFNESLITRARNGLAHQFLQSDCTHLFFIDADIKFDANDAWHMIKADKPLICGIYPKKEINWFQVDQAVRAGVPVNELTNFTGSFVVNLAGGAQAVTVRADRPAEIMAGGTGFMLIKRQVFNKLKKVTPTYRNDLPNLGMGTKIYDFFQTSHCPETGRLLSEDYHFCAQYRSVGGKVYAAPWCKLGHWGSYLFEGSLIRTD